MTALDWVLAAILLLSVLRGLRRGFILTLTALVGMLAGLAVASWYSPVLAVWLHRWVPSPWQAEIFSFLTLLFAVILIAHLIGRALRGGARTIGLGWADRLLGGIFGLARGIVFLGAVFVVLSLFFPGNAWLRQSRLAPWGVSAARGFTGMLPAAPMRRAHDGARRLGTGQWQ